MVERNAKRLLHLIGDLLLITQIEAGKLELKGGDVDLAKLAADGVETARPQAERKRIELRLVCEEEPVVPGDSIRLAQVLDNLISNAVKFTPEEGHVEVRVSSRQGRATIEVEDSGIGISPGEQDALFSPFFRASNAVRREIQGTGLGLVITKAIVEAHEGETHVKATREPALPCGSSCRSRTSTPARVRRRQRWRRDPGDGARAPIGARRRRR